VYAEVDNGMTAQVQLGDIQGMVDITTDSISGTIAAPGISDWVPVECLDWGSGSDTPFPNKDAGWIPADGSAEYACSWAGEWDVQPWQDIGVGYVTPDGHWVANAFRDETAPLLSTGDAGDNEPAGQTAIAALGTGFIGPSTIPAASTSSFRGTGGNPTWIIR
jgi:hypothetical protein